MSKDAGREKPPLPDPGAATAAPARLVPGGELPAGLTIGEYKVTKKLWEGGMGSVYAAVQPLIGKQVAVKVLAPALASHPELVRRFVDEARSVNRIGHPNIIDIFSFGV